MREIKFRVWDGDKLIHVPDIIENGYVNFLAKSGRFDIKKIYTIQQYTGLKDVNGNEIYEGDILAILNEGTGVEDFRGFVRYLPEIAGYSLAGEQKWMRHDLYLVDKVMPGCFANHGEPARTREVDCSRVKIIGNIYENPELLKWIG